MDGSQPGSSVHGISQARILEWVAISFSRGSSWPRNQTCVLYHPCILAPIPPASPSIRPFSPHHIVFTPLGRPYPSLPTMTVSLLPHASISFCPAHLTKLHPLRNLAIYPLQAHSCRSGLCWTQPGKCQHYGFTIIPKPLSLWNLSSPTRDRTWVCSCESADFKHWTSKGFPTTIPLNWFLPTCGNLSTTVSSKLHPSFLKDCFFPFPFSLKPALPRSQKMTLSLMWEGS